MTWIEQLRGTLLNPSFHAQCSEDPESSIQVINPLLDSGLRRNDDVFRVSCRHNPDQMLQLIVGFQG